MKIPNNLNGVPSVNILQLICMMELAIIACAVYYLRGYEMFFEYETVLGNLTQVPTL